MKISIITACYNSGATVADTLMSVSGQRYGSVEHIIVDGGSTDDTLALVEKYGRRVSRVVSGPDAGIYDAINKGITVAGGDIIGILHADDVYYDDSILEKVACAIEKENADSCYGDLIYVARGNIAKTVRYWRSGAYRRERFKMGWMPPHPAFFCRRRLYEELGLYNPDFPLAGDYELMLRFLYRHKRSSAYIPELLVRMRTGGTSQPWSYTVRAIGENIRAWRVNGLRINPVTFCLKPLSKLPQFFAHYGWGGSKDGSHGI